MKAILLAVGLGLTSQVASATIFNRTTGQQYSTLQAAFNAIPSGATNQVLEIDANIVCPNTAFRNKNLSGLVLRGIGGRITLDAGGTDSAVQFTAVSGISIQSITLENLRITNYNVVSSSCAGVRMERIGGDNFLRNLVFDAGSVPMRYTNNSGNLTLDNVEARNFTFGAFRFGLGNVAGVAPGVPDLGVLTFRNVRCYAETNGTNELVLVLKRMQGLLIEDCKFFKAPKGVVEIFDPATGASLVVRRTIFSESFQRATNGAVINILANTATGAGTSGSWLIQNNLFANNKGTCFSGQRLDGLRFNHNTLVEQPGNNVAMVSLNGGQGFTEHVGNLYHCNTASTVAMLNCYQVGGSVSGLRSDHNLWFKRAGSGRAYIGGTIGGVAVSSYSLVDLRSRGWDSASIVYPAQFNGSADPSRPIYMLAPTSQGRNLGNAAFAGPKDLAGNDYTGAPPDVGAYDSDSWNGQSQMLPPAPTAVEAGPASAKARLSPEPKTTSFGALRAYPNPSPEGIFTLEVPNDARSVQVFDASGQPVTERTPLTVDLHQQPAGMYFIQVQTTSGMNVLKVLKP